MHESSGDIFRQHDADAICFTSNGTLKNNGELVMGAGIAKAFKQRWPWLPLLFGKYVKEGGNHVYSAEIERTNGSSVWLVSFPTKEHFSQSSDMKLIVRSAIELLELTVKKEWKRVYLTRPGCGLGGLDWEEDVRYILSLILDDRFTVLHI